MDESIQLDESKNGQIDKSMVVIANAEKRINSIISGALRIIQLPFWLLFILSTLLLFVFIRLVW